MRRCTVEIKCTISGFISLYFCMYLSSAQFKVYVRPEGGGGTQKSVRMNTRERGSSKNVLTLKYFLNCCKLGENGIRKGLDMNFILINQSNGSYLHYPKIDYIKFYSAQLNSQFQYNSKSASICNACTLNSRR